jgi:hypothetical protein
MQPTHTVEIELDQMHTLCMPLLPRLTPWKAVQNLYPQRPWVLVKGVCKGSQLWTVEMSVTFAETGRKGWGTGMHVLYFAPLQVAIYQKGTGLCAKYRGL